MNPGIKRWFSAEGDAVVGFVPAGGIRVVAGAPVCPAERLAVVASEFEDVARDCGEEVCYFCCRIQVGIEPDSDGEPCEIPDRRSA